MDFYDLFLPFSSLNFFLFFSLHFRKTGIELIEVSDIVHKLSSIY